MIRWIFPNIHVSRSLTLPATTLLDIPPQEQEQMLAALRAEAVAEGDFFLVRELTRALGDELPAAQWRC